jgi:hypothetical protein
MFSKCTTGILTASVLANSEQLLHLIVILTSRVDEPLVMRLSGLDREVMAFGTPRLERRCGAELLH